MWPALAISLSVVGLWTVRKMILYINQYPSLIQHHGNRDWWLESE